MWGGVGCNEKGCEVFVLEVLKEVFLFLMNWVVVVEGE